MFLHRYTASFSKRALRKPTNELDVAVQALLLLYLTSSLLWIDSALAQSLNSSSVAVRVQSFQSRLVKRVRLQKKLHRSVTCPPDCDIKVVR